MTSLEKNHDYRMLEVFLCVILSPLNSHVSSGPEDRAGGQHAFRYLLSIR